MTLELVPWRGAHVPLLSRDEITRYTTQDYINWLTSNQRYMGGAPMPVTTYGNRPAEPISTSFEGFVCGMLYGDGPVAAVEAYRLRVFGQAPLLYQEMKDGRPGDLFDDDRLDRLRTPWPGGNLGDLMKRALVYGDFAGNAFVVDLEDELVLLRPDWVEIVLSKRMVRGGQVGWRQVGIVYYEGGIGVGDGVAFLPGEYCHFVPGLPDPLATFRGMSWLTPLVREVQADKSAGDHKVAFFENAASPNLAVSLPKEITPAQFKEFVDKMDSEHRGATQAYKTLYTAGGADVTVIGANMQQMDFSAVQGKGETRIANAGGVSPALLSFSEGMQGSSLNAGNFVPAKRNFVDTTMRDLWTNWAGSVQKMDAFAPPDDRKSRLTYDPRDIPFLRDDEQDIAQRQQTQASTISSLITAGYVPESAQTFVVTDDPMTLEHTGLTSVQLMPPGSQDANGDGVPDAEAQAGADYEAALDEFRSELADWDDEISRAIDAGELDEDEIERRDYYDVRDFRGRFRKISDRIGHALNEWLKGDGEADDPLEEFSRENLRLAAKEFGITPRRGASSDELKLALLKDARARFRGERGDGERKPVRMTLQSPKFRDLDVGVYREADGKVSLYRLSPTSETRGSKIASFDNLAGLEAWGHDNDEPQVAQWASKERGGGKPTKRAPAKKAPAKKASPERAPAAAAKIPSGPATDLDREDQARVRRLVRRDPQIFATVQDRYGRVSTSGNLSNEDAAWLQGIYERDRAFVEYEAQGAELDRRVKDAAKAAGQTPTEYKAAASARLKEILADKPIAVRVRDEGALRDILSGGRFKTQLEGARRAPGLTGDPDRRRLGESILGVPPDAPASERPVYGYVAVAGIEPALSEGRKVPGIREREGQEDVLSSYGKVQVVLKPEVRDRTTATVGDSLDEIGFLRPSPVNDPSIDSLGFRKLDRVTEPGFTRTGYVEAQIHGGIRTEDIAEVVFPDDPDRSTITALERQGVSWRVLRPGDTSPAAPPAKAAPRKAAKSVPASPRVNSTPRTEPAPTPPNPQSPWGQIRDDPDQLPNVPHGRPGYGDQVDRVYTAPTRAKAKAYLKTRDGEQLFNIAETGQLSIRGITPERDRDAYIEAILDGVREPESVPAKATPKPKREPLGDPSPLGTEAKKLMANANGRYELDALLGGRNKRQLQGIAGHVGVAVDDRWTASRLRTEIATALTADPGERTGHLQVMRLNDLLTEMSEPAVALDAAHVRGAADGWADVRAAAPGRSSTATAAQREALHDYKSDDHFREVNDSLFSGTYVAGSSPIVDGVRESMRPLTDDVVVWRGGRGLHRRIPGGSRKSGLDGAEWTRHDFASTSTSERVALDFATNDDGSIAGGQPTVMRIRVPAGTPAVAIDSVLDRTGPDDISRYLDEEELILADGLRYRIARDYGVVRGVRRLDVEVVQNSGPTEPPKKAAKRTLLADPAAKIADLRALGDVEAVRDDLDLHTVAELKTLAKHMGGPQGQYAGMRKREFVDALAGMWPEMRVDEELRRPTKKTAAPKVDAPDPEQSARDRQSRLDAARTAAEALVDLDTMATNGGSAKALRHSVDTRVRMGALTEDEGERLRAALDSAATAPLGANGLPLNTTGLAARRDHVDGGRLWVQVIQPGDVVQDGDGNWRTVDRVRVHDRTHVAAYDAAGEQIFRVPDSGAVPTQIPDSANRFRTAVADILTARGATTHHTVGDTVPFDPSTMRAQGDRPGRGTPVQVVSPGATLTEPDGTVVTLAPTVVMDVAESRRSLTPTEEDEVSRADDEVDDEPTLDDIFAMAEEAEDDVERAAGHDTTPGHDQLHHYWTVDPEGRAKWVDSPKPWTTLVAHLTRHVGLRKAKIFASRWFIEVFGYAAGSDKNRVAHGHPPRGNKVGPG